METKQTALQWFLDKLPHSIETQFSEQIQEALQMEREQIIEAANNGCKGMCMIDTSRDGKNYYNEIYGGNNE